MKKNRTYYFFFKAIDVVQRLLSFFKPNPMLSLYIFQIEQAVLKVLKNQACITKNTKMANYQPRISR
jgi:hypothetical protein